MRCFIACLLLFCTGFIAAAEGGGFEVPGEERPTKEQPAKAEEKPEAAAEAKPAAPALAKVSHRGGTGAIEAYATGKGLKITKYGAGPVRIWLVGGGAVKDADSLIATGEQVIQGLEVWTGKQGLFTPTDDDGHYHIVLFGSDGDYNGWLDQMRKSGAIGQPEGEDLAKKLGGLPIPRGQVKVFQKVEPLMRHYVVYSVTTAAVDVFFRERGGDSRKHSWLREGLAAEMQRLLCDGQVRCYTITYEDASIDLQQDWAKAMAQLIAKRDQTVRPTREVMAFTLIGMPAANYIQMWSLCTYMRLLGKNQKGPDNLFAKLLVSAASGTASDTAVKAVYGKEDPKLSRSWLDWAATYKTDPKGLNR